MTASIPEPSLDVRLRARLPALEPSLYTLTSLLGVRAAGVAAGIKASGKPDVALLVFDAPAAAAAVFTQNLFAAAPVLVSREHLAKSGGIVRAIVVNSGNANACTGDVGLASARAMTADVAEALACPIEHVLVASTGVIGVPLPMPKVRAGVKAALASLSRDVEAGRAFLNAIMTTDAFPKEASTRIGTGKDAITVAGVCKGAGMIHPNMATMLAFVATDADLSSAHLAAAIPHISASSFNAVHVDTHASTNDTFVALALRLQRSDANVARQRDTAVHVEAIASVANRLAWLIARDGEGATKVTTIHVRGARTDVAARNIANLVASSALVRTALYGNDPNWGRFVSQVGNSRDVTSIDGLRCMLQGITVFEDGAPSAFDRDAVALAMNCEDLELVLELNEGDGGARLMTSDLGYKYVEVNAEYTT
jgi:glutamate N-acetyltransferase / amino-acid N-acetyltransferase